MGVKYTPAAMLYLRQSPLCVKPPNLPPAEEWMGPPPEQIRSQNKTTSDRSRAIDNPLLDQTNRRPAIDRSRNSANPEDIVFAPPRMAFASARGNKSLENDKGIKEALEGQGRFGNFRSRNGEAEGERFRDARNSTTTLRRREGAEQESEGWSTVKPRKSFGPEGAERFHGRMGGSLQERRYRDDREAPRERTLRPFDSFTRDKDGDEGENRARNGLARNKSDQPSWFKNEPTEPSHNPEKRERIDRAKSWRDRDVRDTEAVDDRNNGRTHGGRWGRDRDQRAEREPEWLDEPVEEQHEAHTQQDFQKWMEEMKRAKNAASGASKQAAEAAEAVIEEKLPVQSAPAVESGPDKFFMAFGSNAGLDAATPGEPKESASKTKTIGKSSRFTSFFSQPQEEPRGRTEPATPMAGVPMTSAPPNNMPPLPILGGQPPPPEEERQAFQQLLAKLQKQSVSGTPEGPSPFALPLGTPDAGNRKSNITSPEQPFQQYAPPERRMEMRPPPQHVQEILAPRPQPQTARPEQLLQDLMGQMSQHQHQRVTSQGGPRPDAARNNSNTEFLMNLMRAAPEQPRNDPMMMRMGPPKQPQMPPEPDFARDAHVPPQHQMRQPPPGFPMDKAFHSPNPELDGRSNQPTQILQRPPPPPGLDQMPPNWLPSGQMPGGQMPGNNMPGGQMPGGQMPPPQQRGPMLPPPGLPGGLNRNGPMPHMFPPNFPPGGMPPPPEAMGGMPPRNMPPPPPPGFFGGPPHGFMPPGMGGFNGPPGGPDGPFPGGPFDGRGMPPAGNPGRGGAYGRQ